MNRRSSVDPVPIASRLFAEEELLAGSRFSRATGHSSAERAEPPRIARSARGFDMALWIRRFSAAAILMHGRAARGRSALPERGPAGSACEQATAVNQYRWHAGFLGTGRANAHRLSRSRAGSSSLNALQSFVGTHTNPGRSRFS
jgi:hypothetical protein